MIDHPDDDDDTPLTPEELAERDKVPTVGREIFSKAIDANGVLGDVLLDPVATTVKANG
jgi:hypothetical protein